MATLTFLEDIDSVSPNSASCSWTRGRAVAAYRLDAPGVNDLLVAVTTILGNVTSTTTDYRVRRQNPLAHPVHQYWYASDILDIRGEGKPQLVTVPNAAKGLEVAPISTQYALYPKYKFTVEFTQRPYALLSDDKVAVRTDSWTDENNTVRNVTWANEWVRNTDLDFDPREDSVTATQGEMIFRDAAARVHNFRYPGMPRMFLNNQLAKVTVYQLPFRYVTSKNSFLKRWRGRINQHPFFIWDVGEALYLNYRIVKYTPPVQALEVNADPFKKQTQPVTYSTEKFCTVELQFLETVRSTPDTYTPTVANFLRAGHNLLPLASTRQFHYATSFDPADKLNEAKWVPSWLSAPLEALLTNPDAKQPP